jgi:hypothetical protein
VTVDVRCGGDVGVPEQLGHDLDRDTVAQQPSGCGMAVPVRVEVDPGPAPQPPHQVIDRRIGQRVPVRLAPQVDEDVVGIEVTRP